MHFEPIRYSIGDEDNRLEWSLLRRRAHHVVAVASSGARLIPLLARRPQRLTALERCPLQLALTRLRLVALSEWSHETYCAFFGYPPYDLTPAQRRAHFDALPLDATTRERLFPQFEVNGWSDVAYYGRFEKSLIRTSRLVRVLLGDDVRRVFTAQGIQEQRQLLREHFPHKRWQLVLALLSQDDHLRNLLMGPDAFGGVNPQGRAFTHFAARFRHLLHNTLIRESFFLQLLLLGRIEYPEGLPAEAHPLIYEAARAAQCDTTLAIEEDDIVEWLATHDGVDFVSLSDAGAHVDPDVSLSFLDEIRGSLLPGSRVVTRGRIARSEPELTGYHRARDDHRSVLDAESTQLWHVGVYDHEIAA